MVVPAADTAGVALSGEDAPVSGFPVVSGQGSPAEPSRSRSPSLVTVLKSHRAGRLLVGVGHMASGAGVAQPWGLEGSGSPAWHQANSAPCPRRRLDLHLRGLFSREI